jgi:hypothetical protein
MDTAHHQHAAAVALLRFLARPHMVDRCFWKKEKAMSSSEVSIGHKQWAFDQVKELVRPGDWPHYDTHDNVSTQKCAAIYHR